MHDLVPSVRPPVRPSGLAALADTLAGQVTASSIAVYRRDVRQYQAWCDVRGADSLAPESLAAWRDALASSSRKSPNTINRHLAAVKRIVKQAGAAGLVSADVALRFQGVAGVKVRALRERLKTDARTRIEASDMRRLVDAPDSTTLVGLRDKALLLALASSGLRASEAAQLRLVDIRRQGKGYLLSVRGKSDIEPRDAHLSVEAFALISAWIDARPVASDYVFTSFAGRGERRATGRAMSATAIWLAVQKYAQRCGLTHIKPHDFRRFVGTQLAKKDIRRAQLALGHKSIETTARHYVLDRLEPGETDTLF